MLRVQEVTVIRKRKWVKRLEYLNKCLFSKKAIDEVYFSNRFCLLHYVFII